MSARHLISVALLVGAVAPSAAAQPDAARSLLRGSAHIQTFVYNGCPLRPKATDSRLSPLTVRVLGRDAADMWRIEIIGNRIGTFDAADFLECADGAHAENIPAIPVRFVTLLPTGARLDLETAPKPQIRIAASHRWVWPVLGALWLAIPLAVLLARAINKRRREADDIPEPAAVESTLDEFRALIETLGSRPLSVAERSRLELYTLRELLPPDADTLGAPDDVNPYSRALTDPVSAPVLVSLERWLHHPSPPPGAEAELRAHLLDLAARIAPRAEASA